MGTRRWGQPGLPAGMWCSRVAWACLLLFGASSFNAYAVFAWMSDILQDLAGVSAYTAGALVARFPRS